jgi:hypothetical protein
MKKMQKNSFFLTNSSSNELNLKKKSSTAKFLEIIKTSEKVWLRSEKVDPIRCRFSNEMRHIDHSVSQCSQSLLVDVMLCCDR